MTKAWAAAVGAAWLLAGSAAAADAAASVSASAAPAPWTQWKDHGLSVGLGLSALSVFNASPLAYQPLELGWRFSNGVRVRSGLSLFYYEGLDKDEKQPALGTELYSYEMLDWRSSIDYVVPLPFRLRPCAGLSLDLISGSRHRAVPGVVTPPRIGAWSALAPGALLGLDFRGGEAWGLGLEGRYANGFTDSGAVVSADLSWRYLF